MLPQDRPFVCISRHETANLDSFVTVDKLFPRVRAGSKSSDRKVVEVGGQMFVEAPKNRKFRRAVYPRMAPAGYPLAERLAGGDFQPGVRRGLVGSR